MMKTSRLQVTLMLGSALISTSQGRSRPELTTVEALERLANYQGVVQGRHATFPRAVTNTPPLTSMGPTSVTPDCFKDWRAAMHELRQEGYLTSFRGAEDQIAITPADLTAKAKAIVLHVTTASLYGTVRLIPILEAADLRIGEIDLSENRKRAQVEFHATVSEPVRIMRANGLFANGCGADVDPAVMTDNATVAGHAHFRFRKGLRFRKGRWHVERVLLGEHRADDE